MANIKTLKIGTTNYNIVPESLQNSGYVLSAPTLTADENMDDRYRKATDLLY